MTPVREALERLLTTAKLLQQNAEGCATNHYGHDCELNGLPGWLTDTQKDIVAAQEALSAAPGEPCAPSLPKRPFAFAVKRAPENGEDQWRLFMDEAAARAEAEQLDGEYEGLYRVGDRRSAVESLRREAPAPAATPHGKGSDAASVAIPVASSDLLVSQEAPVLSEPPPPADRREIVARIIEPNKWELIDAARAKGLDKWASDLAEPSLAKADAILAALEGGK